MDVVVVERVHVVGAREERGFVESIDGMPQRTSTLAFQKGEYRRARFEEIRMGILEDEKMSHFSNANTR